LLTYSHSPRGSGTDGLLNIVNLEKTIGAFSLTIERLQIHAPGIYGVIGPNGCGKTTTAKLISGILSPDRGNIDISLCGVTMVSQKPYMMDDTVYNNLIYPLRLRGITPNRESCDESLGKIGLLERRNQRARGLSAGERQKLALLRAMIFNPGLIILDEAMTDLDIDSLDMFEGMVMDRQKQNPIVWIIISHQLAHIRRLCGYLFFMAGGRLEAEGPADELLASPNPLIRRYLKHELAESPRGKPE
jgi:ABC-type multidrug transport system ATPase subunit